MGEFNYKVVLVTGGTSGIGGATVSLLAHDGATVIAVGRNEHQGEKISELSDYGSRVCYFKADVCICMMQASPPGCAALWKRTRSGSGNTQYASRDL